jgi:hypothetical protein
MLTLSFTQNLATRDGAQEHRYFNPDDDFLGCKNMLAFQPFKARDLVTEGDKSDCLEFRVQKDVLSRSSEEAPDVDRDEVKNDRDGDDFGMLSVAAEVLHDAGASSLSLRGRPFTCASQV